MILDQKNQEPYINVWFGNFYQPAYEDEEFVKEAISFLKELGFNSVLLDTKDWEDFRERFATGEASQYVKMLEFMQAELERQGLSHEFLALYLNGDNLYPNIRFSPPVYGESVVNPDGSDGKWYRYWSKRAKDAMTEHVAELLTHYRRNHVTVAVEGKERMPLCSMWDPIVAPSFDTEGKERYIGWLKRRYQGDIRAYNAACGTEAESFEGLSPEEYWFSLRYPGSLCFSEEDLLRQTPKCRIMADNKRWQSEELELYFSDMQKRLKEVEPALYLCPDLTQWGYFLNVDGAMLAGVGMADLWDTAVRGIDLYRLSPYVDCTHFISVPVTPDGDPDCYVTACHHAMMRSMNRGRDFIGGIYWGRFLYHDLYAWISPCEVVASMAAAGAAGYTSYGMCGLDDGGVLHRMPEGFLRSLKTANAWAKKVIPLLGHRKEAEAAILFPSAMALYETMRTEHNKDRRMDFLGWFKACCDYGIQADIVDGTILKEEGALKQYRVLILPEDDCYALEPDLALEKKLADWTADGGVVIHGPGSLLAEAAFGSCARQHEKDAFFYREAGMLTGNSFCSFTGGEMLCRWLSDDTAAAVRRNCGKGSIYSFGFSYGWNYTSKIAPHVPREQKNKELYPLSMMKEDPVKDILEQTFGRTFPAHRGIEKAEFENGWLIINHTAYPWLLQEKGSRHFQEDSLQAGKDILLPHMGVFVETSGKNKFWKNSLKREAHSVILK